MLRPCNTVPHGKLFLSLHHYCNVATVRNHNVNFQYVGHLIFNVLQRGHYPQVGKCWCRGCNSRPLKKTEESPEVLPSACSSQGIHAYFPFSRTRGKASNALWFLSPSLTDNLCFLVTYLFPSCTSALAVLKLSW